MNLFWPVGAAPNSPTLPAPWWISVGYAQAYSLGIHTGIDLNLNNYADSGKPVNTIANGVVTFAGEGSRIGWPNARQVVIVYHDALKLWTRYAHLANVNEYVVEGETVRAGDILGVIGDYGKPGGPDDHLHFDIAKVNLYQTPGDWPGSKPDAITRVLSGYVDPIMLFRVANS
jgi:murein DD-endopeptidase MepM/ murein hydrolase activator NlpD